MMENEKAVKRNVEQINQTSDDTGSAISRRQFSLGISGIVLVGTILELSDHHVANSLAVKITAPQKLEPQVLNQAQYVLSGTIGSLWSPDSRHIATFQENIVTLYNASTGTPELSYRQAY
jgi:hypothetical protein